MNHQLTRPSFATLKRLATPHRGVLSCAALLLGLTLLVGGCTTTATQPTTLPALSQPSPESIALKETLPGFAKAHGEKIQLSMYAGSILRPIDPRYKPFYENMGTTQQELLDQLRAWAKANNFNLKYAYPATNDGSARKIMEKRQEAVVRSAKQADFERDMLMSMYSEYEWEISMIKALQPKVTDPALNAYLAKSLAVHEAGSKEITALLKHFRYVP